MNPGEWVNQFGVKCYWKEVEHVPNAHIPVVAGYIGTLVEGICIIFDEDAIIASRALLDLIDHNRKQNPEVASTNIADLPSYSDLRRSK